MSTPRAHARWVRGGLVGASSAAATATAHTAASAELPGGSATAVALLICGTVGALLARIALDDRRARFLAVIAALGVAQALGHLVFSFAGGHHGSASPLGVTPAMAAAHAGAAVVLGAVIVTVEYLYLVCASVLRWLRLFATRGLRPRVRSPRRKAKILVAQSVWVSSGLGMRAPPVRCATA